MYPRSAHRIPALVPFALVIGLLCGEVAAYVLMSPPGAALTGRGVPLSEGPVSVNTQAAAMNGRGSPAAAPSHDSSSRTIFYNGKVFTSVSGALWAEGVVVSGRHIVAVGTNDDMLGYRTADSVLYNLNGRVLVPGFNDAHVHPVRPLAAFTRGPPA